LAPPVAIASEPLLKNPPPKHPVPTTGLAIPFRIAGKPDAPYAAPAIERMKQFIRKHTTG
jgi:hypothetical protein